MIDLEVNLAEVATGQVVYSRRYTLDTSPPSNTGEPGMESGGLELPERGFWGWTTRIVAWLLLVLLLPMITIGFIRLMVTKKSNAANAFTLVIYGLADAALAFLLVGPAALATWVGGVIFLIALVAAVAYNVKIVSTAHRLETA